MAQACNKQHPGWWAKKVVDLTKAGGAAPVLTEEVWELEKVQGPTFISIHTTWVVYLINSFFVLRPNELREARAALRLAAPRYDSFEARD